MLGRKEPAWSGSQYFGLYASFPAVELAAEVEKMLVSLRGSV